MRLLIVEDEARLADTLRQLLYRQGPLRRSSVRTQASSSSGSKGLVR